MSDEAECTHGLGPFSACTICNGRDKRERDEQYRAASPPFVARFAGTCRRCGEVIEEGDLIVRTLVEDYLHRHCAT